MLTNITTDLAAHIQPVLVETLFTLILAAMAWLMRRLPAWMQVQIEAKHRSALHSALETGVKLILDRLMTAGTTAGALAKADQSVGTVVGYVRNSVPDALKALAPTQAQLERMATAKLNEALAQLDPLTGALKQAGAPVEGAA